MTAVAMAAGGALDVARALEARRSAQAGVDAALLASAKPSFPTIDARRDFAREVFNRVVPDYVSDNVTEFDFVPGPDGLTYALEVRSKVDTMLLRLGGVSKLDVTADAKAEVLPAKSLELALALDSTGSMRGDKMTTLKRASKDLIASIEGGEGVRVSVVPFAAYVNVGVENGSEEGFNIPDPLPSQRVCSWWSCWWTGPQVFEGCVGSLPGESDFRAALGGRLVPGLLNTSCSNPLQRLTADFQDARDTIDDMNASGATYIPAGLIWAWRTLTHDTPFRDGTNTAEDEEMRKFIVLMTDGENTRSVDSRNGYHHYGNHNGVADQLTSKICEEAKKDEIAIYTVAFEVYDRDTLEMLKECASDPSTMFYAAENAPALVQAFDKIATDFKGVRLVN